jgi:hypothetical protein
MAAETTWYHYEVTLDGADPIAEKVPANTQAEARLKLARIYPGARTVRFVRKERKASVTGGFDPTRANRRVRSAKAASSPLEGLGRFPCPVCEQAVTHVLSEQTQRISCPSCQTELTLTPATGGLHYVAFAVEVPVQQTTSAASAGPATPPDWQTVFGLSAEATKKDIRAAYLELIKAYHPDRVSHLGPELVAFAEAKTAELNEALKLALKARGRS